jgi:tetratricopeptide (TPR) repeat protein
LNISAYDDALRQLERAVKLIPIDNPDRGRLQVSLGQAYFYASDPVQAKIALQETLEAAEKSGQDQLAADALYWSSRVSIQEGGFQEANKKLEYALELARKADVSETVARVAFGLGDLHWRLNQLDDARAFIDESLVLAQKLGDPHLEIRALNRLGTIESYERNWDRANELLTLTLDKAQQLGDRELAGTALNNLGYIASEIGDEELARDYASRALPIARETGNLQALAIYTFNLAESNIRYGDLESAKALMVESLNAARRIGAVPPMLFVIHLAGWIEALDENRETGLAYMGFCLNHPATYKGLRHNVRQKLHFLNLDPDDPEIQKAMEKGKELKLEEVCALLLEEYSSFE